MRTVGSLTAAVLAVLLTAALFSGCAGTTGKTSGSENDDLTITARVKTALLNDPEITAPRIDVETVKGVVTLSGRVASKEEEQKAMKVARSIRGVVDVKSTLQIQP